MARAVRERGVDQAANLIDLATCINCVRRFLDHACEIPYSRNAAAPVQKTVTLSWAHTKPQV
jgi:hypothetical protein